MAAQKGSAMLLKVDISGTATTVAGLRSTSITMNDEAVDVTTKDSSGLTAAFRRAVVFNHFPHLVQVSLLIDTVRSCCSHSFRCSKNSGNIRTDFRCESVPGFGTFAGPMMISIY